MTFLFPDVNSKINFGRSDTKHITNESALFLLVSLSLHSTGTVFNILLDKLYFKFGQLSIWPHRSRIISNMPKSFKREFPTSLIIIDGTEFKTHVPNALCLQSQLYSSYKSSTTLKARIGCDPCGSVIFISELFTGSISDKAICEESGFFQLLKDLVEHGYIQRGDCVMADKGFTIANELKEIGLGLNIPPFATGSQMSMSDTYLTSKIAKHGVHIERLISSPEHEVLK